DGTFQDAVHFAAGARPVAVAAADITGTGDLDLVVVNTDSNSVTVLFNAGGGDFGASQSFATGALPRSVAIGDFNGDGNPDAVVANFGISTFSLLLHNGAGGFLPAISFGAAVGVMAGPIDLVVADFDNDGNDDVATANAATNNVSVFLGDGTGSFGSAT